MQSFMLFLSMLAGFLLVCMGCLFSKAKEPVWMSATLFAAGILLVAISFMVG